MRDRIFEAMTPEWLDAYDAGIFTEFMEQRAPGHTVLDDKIYRKGLLDFKREIAEAIDALDCFERPRRLRQARAAHGDGHRVRRADSASPGGTPSWPLDKAAEETDPARKAELEKIADVCTHVPADAPRDFHEALQYYWFCHLAVITELNGWDCFCPGHLDQHLLPFYRKGIADGTLTPRVRPRAARERSSSSSTITRPRRRSASRRPRAARTPTSRTSTSAGCSPTARTARTKSRTCCWT